MPLVTELTRRLQITQPIISAPMAFAAGGKLAVAVTEAGGLGSSTEVTTMRGG